MAHAQASGTLPQFAPAEDVRAERALVRQSLVDSVHTTGNAILTNSAMRQLHADKDAVLTMSAAVQASAGQDMHLQNSAGALVTANNVQAEQSFIGLLIAREATLEHTRVLLTIRTALILGILLGGLPPLIRALFERLWPKPPAAEQPKRPVLQRFGFWLLGIAIRIGLIALGVWLIRRWIEQRLGWLLKLLQPKNA